MPLTFTKWPSLGRFLSDKSSPSYLIGFAVNSPKENCSDSSDNDNMQETNKNNEDYEENRPS
ncbi:4892_t:CDS:2 [Cetraspora pellucida]|uniref:4892_t:CDS:1 n=1 Tax=Cetraspora pellucida TaxID=1433469 RepID=A0A9N9I5U0_9GLOM|nr:4892_t:CDS:2 [Cetraspora pellucida]